MSKNIIKEDLGSLVSTGNARTKEYFDQLKAAEEQNICPFCNPAIWKNQTIKETMHWKLKCNDYPYKHHLFHFVIVFGKHTNDVSEVPPAAWKELGEIIQWAVKEFDIPGGGFAMRFGLSEYNASTVRHLHAHIQVPDLTGPAKATFAKSEEKKLQDKERIASFQT